MFDEKSRYRNLDVLTFTTATGDEIRYVSRRFLPDPATLGEFARVRVSDSDRLDLIAHRNLGEPTLFWRIADANRAMEPNELLEPVGRQLSVPTPGS